MPGAMRAICIIASPEEIGRVTKEQPDADIFRASIGDRLYGKGFIIPGLGDCGDRLYGTR